MTHSHTSNLVPGLRREVELFLDQCDRTRAMASLLNGSADRALYVAFLVQTRHYVARTYPLLSDSAARLRALGSNPLLADLLAQKAGEETGHDLLIDDDFEALGIEPRQAMSDPPKRWIVTYNAWGAAMSMGRHPCGFLGSAYILESLAIHRAGRISEALVRAARIPGIAGAVSFLDLHAEADVAHVADMDALLSDLEDEAEIEAILLTAQATRTAYVGQLEEIAESLARG